MTNHAVSLMPQTTRSPRRLYRKEKQTNRITEASREPLPMAASCGGRRYPSCLFNGTTLPSKNLPLFLSSCLTPFPAADSMRFLQVWAHSLVSPEWQLWMRKGQCKIQGSWGRGGNDNSLPCFSTGRTKCRLQKARGGCTFCLGLGGLQ